ncbi:intermembrane phospholipid transport protein YdbH family protein [Methylomonas sp. MgM2]
MAEQAASDTQPRPGKRRSKRRFSVVLVSLIAAASAGIYYFHDLIVQWGLQRLLEQTPLQLPKSAGLSFGLSSAEIAHAEFNLQTAAGLIAVQLSDVTANYDLKTARVDSLYVADAKISWVYRAENPSSEKQNIDPTEIGALIPLPSLPIRELTIETLRLDLDSLWGHSNFSGRAGFSQDQDKLQALLTDQNMKLTVKIDRNSAALSIEQGGLQPVAQLDLKQTEKKHYRADLNADAVSLLNWLTGSSLIPSKIRSDLAASISAQNIPALSGIKLNLQFRSNDALKNLKGRMLLTRNDSYLSSAEITLNTQNLRATADGHLDMVLADLLDIAKPWLPAESTAWQTTGGNVTGTFRGQWLPQTEVRGEMYLRAYNVAGNLGPARLEGGFSRLDVKTLLPLTALLEVDIPDLQLGKDTRLNHLQLKAAIDGRWFSVKKAELPIFGGLLEISPTRIDLENTPLSLTLNIRKLDLGQLLQSLNYPELSGTGSISGKLPLRLSKQSIEVINGELNGTRPGVLRYQGAVTDTSNIAFKALQNLLYHKLQGKLNYQANGDYRLGLRLEGKNPEVLSGHPVAFNLNLSGHLPELLQKGLMAGDFDQPILEHLKTNGNR